MSVFLWLCIGVSLCVGAVLGTLAVKLRAGLTRRLVSGVLMLTVVGWLTFFVSWTQDQMHEIRQEYKLTDDTPLQNAPPMVAFVTVALGGFRGLMVDFLFLRARQMQEAENYFELVQLASWCVKLQPRFTGAQAYLAWNLSYNISVLFREKEVRWRWVQRGIELLRNEAIIYNPDCADLYQELGWLFQHKIGQDMDDAHMYYKAQLALQVVQVLGHGDLDWAKLAAHPDTPEKLQATLGETRWGKLQQIFQAHDTTLPRIEEEFQEESKFKGDIGEALVKAELNDAVETYIRVRWFRQKFNMDPGLIVEIREKYGDLDFRVAPSHAIYWATLGLKHSEGEMHTTCERMICQSMHDSFYNGRIVGVSADGFPMLTHNFDIVDGAILAYTSAYGHHKDSSMSDGFQNFLIDVVVNLFLGGREVKAMEVYTILRSSGQWDGSEYKVSLDAFVMDELSEDMGNKSWRQMNNILQLLLSRSYEALATRKYNDYTRRRKMALRIHERYTEFLVNEKSSAKKMRAIQRKGIDFAKVDRNVMRRCLKEFPPDWVGSLRIELERLFEESGMNIQMLQEPEEDEILNSAVPHIQKN